MRTKSRILLLMCCFMLIYQYTTAQTDTIHGTVNDKATGEALIGVTLYVKEANTGAVTNADGRFSLKAKNGATVLVSYIGYKPQEFTATTKSDIKILLEPETQNLDEIVIVGYGTQKKASSVGSISSISGDNLKKAGNVTTISEALQGMMPGVVAINSSSKPGADAAELLVRGKASWKSTAPLCLVDGVERDFNDIDINEVKTISVLKDASATAVYGVKGANGVILVTTHRGTQDKPTINFSANFGFKQPTVKFNWGSYPDAMRLYNEAIANDMQWDKTIPESTIAAWEHAYATGNYGPYNDVFPQVDWWEESVRDVGFQQTYNVNVGGGSERVSYFVSLGYLNDGDIYKTEKQAEYDPRFAYDRYNWRSNLDFKLTQTTKLSVDIAGKMAYRNQPFFRDPDSDNYFFQPFMQVSTNEFPIKYSDGEWGESPVGGQNFIANLNDKGQRSYKSFQGFYDVALNQKLDFVTKGLSFNAKLSYTSYSDTQSSIGAGRIYGYNDSDAEKNAIRYYREYDYANPTINADGTLTYPLRLNRRLPNDDVPDTTPNGVSYDNFDNYGRKLYYEIAVNYARDFNGHNITALALFNRNQSENTLSGNNTKMEFPSYAEDWVGRATYNWKERYLFEVNAAYTGSEKFAPGKRFGFFPSFSAGWRVTEEEWFKKLVGERVISNFKIRYSWGKVGSDRGAPRFNYIQQFSTGGNIQLGLTNSNAFGPLYSEGKLGDVNATWEKSTKQNLGIEMTMFSKLNITADFFDEQREDILMERKTVASWIGVALPSFNLGKTKNHGMELSVNWNDKIGEDFRYNATFNFATSENRVVFRDDPIKLDEYLKSAGKPIGSSSKYITTGNFGSIDDIFNSPTTSLGGATQGQLVPGDLFFIDYDGDGIISDRDMVSSQHLNYPLTTYSLQLGFTYKGFGFSAQLYAATGVYKEQITNMLFDFPGTSIKIQPNAQQRWTDVNIGSNGIVRPSLHLNNKHNVVGSNYTYADHSYLRLKNVELSYAFNKKALSKLYISKFQVYVNVTNLFTLSNVDKRRDPELGGSSAYPIVRRFNTGVRLSF